MNRRALSVCLTLTLGSVPSATAESLIDMLYLKFGGMRPGSGIGGGVELRNDHFRNGTLDVRLETKVSIRLYQQHELEIIRPHFLSPKVFVEFLGLYRSHTQVDFFGIGPESEDGDHSNYRIGGFGALVTAGYRPARRAQIGARTGYIQANIGPGTDSSLPSVEDVFDPGSVPGLGDSPSHGVFALFFVYDWRDDPEDPRSGGVYEVQSSRYEDIGFDRYDFNDLQYDIQHYVPLVDQLTFVTRVSGILTRAAKGQTVPFHLMPSLGGSSSLHAFENDRFRDRNSFVLNNELRWFASQTIRVSTFVDVGEVFPELGAFRWSALQLSYGAGAQYKLGSSILMGLNAGFGREGVRFSLEGDFRF